MNKNTFLTIIAPFILAIIGYVLKVYALPFLTEKVIPFIYSKIDPDLRKIIFNHIRIAVITAEREFKEKGVGEAKKKFVLDLIKHKFGWKIDMETLDNLIELAVAEMKKWQEENKIELPKE